MLENCVVCFVGSIASKVTPIGPFTFTLPQNSEASYTVMRIKLYIAVANAMAIVQTTNLK